MQQYLRKVRASFNGGFVVNPGGIQKHELKIEFDISKDVSSTANAATIKIYNLNESHRNSIGKEFDEIVLEAGYMPPDGMGNVGVIFKGAARDVDHIPDLNGNIVTTISCGDGDKALRRANISKSFARGTPVTEVVEELYKQLEKEGVSRGEMKFPDDMPEKFKRPYAACGSCRRELDTIGRGMGFYWNIQNQTFEIIPGGGFVGGVVVLSAETGLVDTPTITDTGFKFKALLNPEIRPNRRVQVISKTLEMNSENGMGRVSSATYTGDNYDGGFFVEGHAEALQGGKVDEGKKS